MNRRIQLFFVDAFIWIFAIFSASLLRYEFASTELDFGNLAWFVLLDLFLLAVIGTYFGLYRGRNLIGGFDEVVNIVKTVSVITAISILVIFAQGSPRFLALSIPLIMFPFAILLMFGARYLYRFRRILKRQKIGGKRTLVAGDSNETDFILKTLFADSNLGMVPVGILSYSELRKNSKVLNVSALGTAKDFEEIVQRHEIEVLLVSGQSANASRILDLTEVAKKYEVEVRVLPLLSSILSEDITSASITYHPVEVADLLGRRELNLNIDAINHVFSGKTILITGAGGSIGSEIARQISRFSPAKLLMLDRDESALHALQLTISGHGLLTDEDYVLADIRDLSRVKEIFEGHKPEIVIHAAALKHLPLLQASPMEAWKTNVIGTQNIIVAAKQIGVSLFVNISTDKAADPSSVLGFTKRATERLTANQEFTNGGKYVSVRFGNVLASRGSVLETFEFQIKNGGPITVTDPEVTRYFMTIPEASQLVLQSLTVGNSGEVLVLDMGSPVKILDVAKFLVLQSGKPIDIEFTGLRDGEKLHEVLRGSEEDVRTGDHPLISHTSVPPLNSLDEIESEFKESFVNK
jgi:FlaA1/EpsC-like NDP-sugar epimerase